MSCRKLRFTFLAAATFLALVQTVSAQSRAVTKCYRGAVGKSHIQMTLEFMGGVVTGKYSHDSVGQDIKLTGKVDGSGKLELTEFGVKNKPTGKFTCKRGLNDPIDPECFWTKPDGSSESFVTLTEQSIALSGGLQVSPKLITNRAKGIGVSYPQLENASGPLSAAAQKFNRRILALTQKAIADDFQPIDDKGTFD